MPEELLWLLGYHVGLCKAAMAAVGPEMLHALRISDVPVYVSVDKPGSLMQKKAFVGKFQLK